MISSRAAHLILEVNTVSISAKDKRVIQDLARRVAEIAALPEQAEKAALWRRFNRLEQVKPLVLIFPEGSWRETGIDEACEVEDEAWRGHEWGLRAKIYYHEVLKDDNVVWPTIHSPIVIHSSCFGIAGQTTRPVEPTGEAHYDPVFVLLAIFLALAIFGLPLLWKSPRFEVWQKVVVSIVTVIYTAVILGFMYYLIFVIMIPYFNRWGTVLDSAM